MQPRLLNRRENGGDFFFIYSTVSEQWRSEIKGHMISQGYLSGAWILSQMTDNETDDD